MGKEKNLSFSLSLSLSLIDFERLDTYRYERGGDQDGVECGSGKDVQG